MLVVATQSAKEAVMYMDANRVDKKDTRLSHRGIMGDVVLTSRPRGPRLDGVFIKPSLRKQELALDVEFADLAASGEVKFTAALADWKSGKVEKTFTATCCRSTRQEDYPWLGNGQTRVCGISSNRIYIASASRPKAQESKTAWPSALVFASSASMESGSC
jgi:hypothetical protein